MTVGEALARPGLDPVDARVLLQHVLGVSHAALIAHPERVLDESEQTAFEALAGRRAAGEPVAYLIGAREFYGRSFAVGPAVLVPRPETELLVELALERIEPDASVRVLDLGTGSGNIALTLALDRPRCTVTAVDVSAEALATAEANRVALGVRNVELVQSDWFGQLEGRTFDLIVSNPPYVAEGDPHLGQGDLRFEPSLALRGGADGLAAIRRIVAEARAHLEIGGSLLFEHGWNQGEACRELLRSAGYEEVLTFEDLAKLPRVSAGRRAR